MHLEQRTLLRILLATLLLSTRADTALADCDGRPDGMCFIPDVPGQFRALAPLADTLGFNISTTPDPSTCRHYQGLARVDAAADGTPFFLVTRSGNLPSTVPLGLADLVCDDSPNEPKNGNLVVFRMDSRTGTGERLRSNRLHKGVHVNQTPPPDEDVAAVFYTVVGGDPAAASVCDRPGLLFRHGSADEDGDGQNDCPSPPNHVLQHPGGMQRIGHVLALAADTPRDVLRECYARCSLFTDSIVREACEDACDQSVVYEPASEPSIVMFFDVSDPVHPVFKSRFLPTDENGQILHDADGLAVTPLPNGRYLMAVTAGFFGDDPIHFYRSTPHALDDPNLAWEYVDSAPDPNDHDEDAHQSLHFLREGSIEGDLYLAGSRGHPVFGADHDKIDLYRVACATPDCAPGETVTLTTRYRGQPVGTFPNTGGGRIANLAAAAGFYESPSGELIFYATEHDNDGPDGSVNAGEWRHQDVVRESSPTLLPTASLNGPFEVDEGSSIAVTGTAAPPLTRAWIQLFSETNFGGLYPVVDYDDYARDDFDNFFVLELRIDPFAPDPIISLNDKARSLKWYAPVGCSITALDHDADGAIDETLTLTGTSATQRYADLSTVTNDVGSGNVDREIDAVRFNADCANYYATPVGLGWDLDGNGSYEATGTSVPFSAAAIDGPSVVQLSAQARHPAGGAPGTASTTVTVRNVAPQFTQFSVTDSAGHQLGTDVPFVLTKVPVVVSAAFSDPGTLDHQTASVAWGDGVTDPNTAFTTFDEAFGDAVGALSHTHRYLAAGDLTLSLAVRDDDGGQDTRSQSVKVVRPEQAVQEVIVLLQGKIASETNRITKEILQKALKFLTGSPPDPSKNGALGMIVAGNNGSAIAFLRDAIGWLKAAQSRGADVGLLISLLEQVILALSAT